MQHGTTQLRRCACRSDDTGLPDGHASYGVLGNSAGPAYFIGCAFEHHSLSAFNLSGASNYTFYALQTEATPQALVIANSSHVLIYGTVITHGGSWVESLVYIDESSRQTEIYGLNTLMKRQPLPLRPWVMVSVSGNLSLDVPALEPSTDHGGGSGDWGGRCMNSDCAIAVLLK